MAVPIMLQPKKAANVQQHTTSGHYGMAWLLICCNRAALKYILNKKRYGGKNNKGGEFLLCGAVW